MRPFTVKRAAKCLHRLRDLQPVVGKGQRQQAARNITEKFESMFRAFGYKHIEITWNEGKEGNTGKTQQ